MAESLPCGTAVFALRLRLLWAAALVLPAFVAQAGVVLTSLYSFQSFSNGASPYGGLVQGSDGNFYGTTSSGGTSSNGTVFKITSQGALTTLYCFTGGNDGGNPQAGLVQGSDGNFYGTTKSGGLGVSPGVFPGYGTVFKISTNGAMTTLYSFTGADDGGWPYAGLAAGSDGNFYGTTFSGGTNGYGAAFNISTNGTMTRLHSFSGATDGANPHADLLQGQDGNFYGTTWDGGANNWGVVFKMSTNGSVTGLYSFTGGDDGGGPYAGLVQGRDGCLYGATAYGGAYTNQSAQGYGTVFKISTIGAMTNLHSFAGGNDGAIPTAPLVQGSDGSFYGTTVYGGAYANQSGQRCGTVFNINTNGAMTNLASFNGANDGANPYAGLVQGGDGSFYGTTESGGLGEGGGTVFRLTVVPAFQAVSLTEGMLNLTWSTEAGGMYQVQYNSALSSSNWTLLGSALIATGATLSATDSVTASPQRFYRVVLLP